MAEQASSSIRIAAPRSQVMDVIADVEAYPQWAGYIKTAEVLESGAAGRPAQARFVLDAGVLRDDYVLAYDWHGDERVTWSLVRGQALKRQDGSYTLAEQGGGTEVTYHLTVDLVVPMLALLKRKAEKVIIDTALKELKKRVEG